MYIREPLAHPAYMTVRPKLVIAIDAGSTPEKHLMRDKWGFFVTSCAPKLTGIRTPTAYIFHFIAQLSTPNPTTTTVANCQR